MSSSDREEQRRNLRQYHVEARKTNPTQSTAPPIFSQSPRPPNSDMDAWGRSYHHLVPNQLGYDPRRYRYNHYRNDANTEPYDPGAIFRRNYGYEPPPNGIAVQAANSATFMPRDYRSQLPQYYAAEIRAQIAERSRPPMYRGQTEVNAVQAANSATFMPRDYWSQLPQYDAAEIRAQIAERSRPPMYRGQTEVNAVEAANSANFMPRNYRSWLPQYDAAEIGAQIAERCCPPMYRGQTEVTDDILFQYGNNLENFAKLAKSTEGFYIGKWKPGIHFPLPVGGFSTCSTNYIEACDAANFAVDELNRMEGKNLTVKRIVRVNVQLVAGCVFYLTFEASDSKFYEAKVYYWSLTQRIRVLFVRPAVHYPVIHPEILRYDLP